MPNGWWVDYIFQKDLKHVESTKQFNMSQKNEQPLTNKIMSQVIEIATWGGGKLGCSVVNVWVQGLWCQAQGAHTSCLQGNVAAQRPAVTIHRFSGGLVMDSDFCEETPSGRG